MNAPQPNGHDRPAAPAGTLDALVERLRWQVWFYVHHFIEGDGAWGQMRLSLAVVVVILFTVISRLFEDIGPLWMVDYVVDQLALRGVLPDRLLALVNFFASFASRQVLRHAIPPLLGIGVALYFGAAYLKDLLELPNLQQAFRYLVSTLFGRDYPRMTISEGQAKVAHPETNPMLRIGGPGYVDIKIGNAALFERVVGPSAVLGAGTHFIRRFETLREAYDLREVERTKDNVKMMTKDGLPIIVNEMRVRFRIRARMVRTEANPYPVMTGAVRRAAYSRKVSANGLEVWADMVAGAARGTIADWVARHRMDELIPPPRDGNQPEPPPAIPYRQALHALFQDKNTRKKFADMGAEIIWVSAGHIRPDPDVDPDLKLEGDPTGHDKIHQQLIDTWKSTHKALAQDEIADAKAYARWLSDTTRAEAETELILSLTTGLREARADGLPVDDVLADRMIEYVAGVRRRNTADPERLQRVLTAIGLLESGYPNEPTNLLPK